MLRKPEISAGLMGHLAHKQTLPIYLYYWKEFCVSKWVGLDNETASTNSPWEGLLSDGFVRLRFGGLIFGILRYYVRTPSLRSQSVR